MKNLIKKAKCSFLITLIIIISAQYLFGQQSVTIRDSLKIISPKNGDSVTEKQMVKGFLNRQNAIVWVIVHPMETSEYWVQQPATIRNNGSWNCLSSFGRPGNSDLLKYFEFRAVINPVEILSTSRTLSNWPNAELQSDINMVIRK